MARKIVSKCKSSTNGWSNSVAKMDHIVHGTDENARIQNISGKCAMVQRVNLKSGE